MTDNYYYKNETDNVRSNSQNDEDTDAAMWGEIIFSCLYLVVVWCLVLAMTLARCRQSRYQDPQVCPIQQQQQQQQQHQDDHKSQRRIIATLFTVAFGLLAFGDTFHLVCRIWAYGTGDMENATLGNTDLGLVGFGGVVRYFLFAEKMRYKD